MSTRVKSPLLVLTARSYFSWVATVFWKLAACALLKRSDFGGLPKKGDERSRLANLQSAGTVSHTDAFGSAVGAQLKHHTTTQLYNRTRWVCLRTPTCSIRTTDGLNFMFRCVLILSPWHAAACCESGVAKGSVSCFAMGGAFSRDA